MNTDTLEACMAASFADTPFPVVVGRLAAAGVSFFVHRRPRDAAQDLL